MYNPFLIENVFLFSLSFFFTLLLLIHANTWEWEMRMRRKSVPFSFRTTHKIEMEKGLCQELKYMSAYTSHSVLSRPGPASPANLVISIHYFYSHCKTGWSPRSNFTRKRPGAANASSSAPCSPSPSQQAFSSLSRHGLPRLFEKQCC